MDQSQQNQNPPDPETLHAQARELMKETLRVKRGMTKVLDILIHKLSAHIAEHANDGEALDPNTVMPAVRDLADVITVMARVSGDRPRTQKRRGPKPGWYWIRSQATGAAGTQPGARPAWWDGLRWWSAPPQQGGRPSSQPSSGASPNVP